MMTWGEALDAAMGRMSSRAYVLMKHLYRRTSEGAKGLSLDVPDEETTELLDVSPGTLRKVKQELEQHRLARVETGNGRGHVTRYTILPPEQWTL